MEELFVKTGEIISVRSWGGGKIWELDLYLPNVNFNKWNTAQSIKYRISPFHYIDYTLSSWDVDEKICTLYIDTTYTRQGSIWTENQVEGNLFHYHKIQSEKHYPATGKNLFFLGDATAIGRFCALQQLAGKRAKISGYINFDNQQISDDFAEYCPWLPLEGLSKNLDILDKTEKWLIKNQSDKKDFVFYIAGRSDLVTKLGKLLKDYGIGKYQVKSKEFQNL